MRKLVNFSLDNPVLVIAAWLLMAGLGLFSLSTLPIDAVPDVTNVQVQILTNSPGLPPEDVERFITFPVETAMSGLPELDEIRSVSKFGLSVVTVVFKEKTDIYWARQLVGERLNRAIEEIPEGYGHPEMGPISTGLGEIYQFEVRGEGYSPMDLRNILDWTVNYQLRTVPGVVEVNSFGGELMTYQVTVNPNLLNKYHLTLQDVFAALETNNRNVGGGYIESQGEQYLIRGEGLITSLNDLQKVVLKHDPDANAPVLIEHIGEVEHAPLIRQGAVTRDGKGEVVIGIVMMLMGENSRVVSKRVDAKIKKIQASLPEGVSIHTFYDRTDLVDRTIKTVSTNLLEGGLLVVLVLLLLLGSFRGGFIVALSIPLSMLVAFTVMRVVGVSGNLMSLGALDFGLIVDGSVVMIENVVRNLHQQRDQSLSHLEKVRRACLEVTRPVVFAVSIIILVYIPILALTGIEGKMFKPMALTVVFALVASLFCALTLMPVLASLFLKNVKEKQPLLYRISRRLYVPLLKRVTPRPVITLTASLLVFAVSMAMTPFMGAEFIPKLDEGAIAMQVWRLPSISLEKSNQISAQVERVILEEFPEVETVISRTGRAEIATDPMGVEISDVFVFLRAREDWRFKSKEELVEAIDHHLQESVAGAKFSFSQPIELRVSELISGVRSDLAIKIYGDDLAHMKQKADEVVEILSEIEGAADVKAEQVDGLPTLRIQVDRASLARYGVLADDVLDVVDSLGGHRVGTIMDGQKRFDLQVRIDPAFRSDIDKISNLLIGSSGNAHQRQIPLAQLAEIGIEEGPAQISRDQISRRVSIEANVRGRDLASFVNEAQIKLESEFKLPEGWFLSWSGQFENLQAASKRLAILVPVVLALIFLVLYTAFGSARLATLIYLNVPLAISGGIFALFVRGYPFSISAGVGFIALFGVAVLNGVVLVSRIHDLQLTGVKITEAAMEGAINRLRPVLMTALVASLGFVPMALATSAGAEVQRPLATVVIGGLVTSTLLTLFVIPTLYRWFGKEVPNK